MKIAISSICRGHLYALARELGRKNCLAAVYSGYPRSMVVRRDNLPKALVRDFPWLHMPYMVLQRYGLLGKRTNRLFARLDFAAYDRHVASHLAEADIFHGLSCHNLRAGRLAQQRGMRYVCDRGSSHISYQDKILTEEGDRIGVPTRPVDPKVIATELVEYATCDRIFVPSTFARNTFLAAGIPTEKIWSIPYGVNLERWRPVPVPADGKFRIVYLGSISFRKGIQDLLAAFAGARLPDAELVLIGSHSPESEKLLAGCRRDPRILIVGHASQGQILEWMARSTVFVLPSIEDGFGLVIMEALACGVPVIATANTGGPDIIEEGVSGYIVPIRAPAVLAEKLAYLYTHREHCVAMRAEALKAVRRFGGWGHFAEAMIAKYAQLLASPRQPIR